LLKIVGKLALGGLALVMAFTACPELWRAELPDP